MKTYEELVESLASQKFGEWTFINTNHGRERDSERTGDISDEDWHDHIHKIIKRVSGTKIGTDKGGSEHMFHQPKKQLATVMNVDQNAKQLRCITVMPKKKNPIPKAGTKKWMIEQINWIDVSDVILD